jgi:manganese/iron transport system permease protein/iron/zinc/copper transport system permease protein
MMSIGEILAYEHNQEAIFAGALIGFANGYLSGYIVLRKSALMVSSLSHSLLPGLVVASFLVGLSALSGFAGALIAALIVGLGAILISKRSPLDGHSALGILHTGAFGAGLLLLSRAPGNVDLDHWLFGDILGLADADLWTAHGISAVVLLTLTAFQRPLLLMLFEPSVARSVGVPVKQLDHLLMALSVLALVNSLQAVGCILSIGLLVTPAAILHLFASSPRVLFWGGGMLGAVASVLAVFLSNWFDYPTGATIVVLLAGGFLLAFAVRQISDAVVRPAA